jgi:hypothetical protein
MLLRSIVDIIVVIRSDIQSHGESRATLYTEFCKAFSQSVNAFSSQKVLANETQGP